MRSTIHRPHFILSSMNPLIAFVSSVIETFEIDYAFSSLLLYDHVLCITEEVEYFWTGPWSLSRFLYLAIRYTGLGFALFSIVTLRLSVSASHECTLLLIKFCVFILPITILCQSVITLRIWYLFSRNWAVRTFAAALLIASTAASIVLLTVQWKTIRFEIFNPLLPSSPSVALVYVPSLVIHTILFALKVYRFGTSSVRMQTDSLLWGFVKEGMFMYACASASLLFGVVGLTMVNPSQLAVRAAAAGGSTTTTLIVISVCRAMLSIRSVAATGHVDPEWLLNHAELSRVNWRRGSVDGEIIVDVGEAHAIMPGV